MYRYDPYDRQLVNERVAARKRAGRAAFRG